MTKKLREEILLAKSGLSEETQRPYFMFFRNSRGQTSTLEFAALVIVLAVALVAMQQYISRAIQGRLRESADSVGRPYDPGNTTSDFTTTSSSLVHSATNVEVDLSTSPGTTSSTTTVETVSDETRRYGYETVGVAGSTRTRTPRPPRTNPPTTTPPRRQ